EDGRKRIEDPALTTLARAKARDLTEAFSTWLYSDETRRERVVTEYNRVFNSFVAPDYSTQGAALELPGLTADISPHPYQREAVARIVSEPTVLLDHVVGAGKTGTMTMAAKELRRLGVAQKPWIVVPNHLVDQVAREFTQWYPSARVLAFPSALDLQGRKQYVAASAAGDWDAVVVPYSVFEKISVAPERASAWLSEEIDEAREAITEAKETGQKFTVKQAEARVKRLETAMATYQSGKDIGLTFEESGCDYLFVDEAHSFKNLSRVSDFSELSHTGSNRAQDLDYKLRALRETKTAQAEAAGLNVSTYQPAVATFATGTPVANSLAEMWVMQHYLRPDLLERAGMTNVNSWGNAFTQFAQRMEVDPSGSKYRSVARLSKFQNLPELLGMSQQFTSTVGTEDLTAALPELAGGERTALVREASSAVAAFVTQLGERAETVRAGVDPSKDNMLKITNDGRAAALDPRLMGLPADVDGGRVHQVSNEVMRIWEENTSNVYKNGLGEDHPTLGGLQLLFCDRAIPNDEGKFSIYDEIKAELVERGIPESMVAFIHDAKDDADKAELFERCRTGSVQVLIGSTERMGTGTNVQARAVALHHVDIPWRPADLEQREGRILRQGNQNASVQICNYITAGTFDAYMWQTVARKAEFIAQVKHAQVTERVVEDISSSSALAFAELSALATGNPDAIRYAEVMGAIAELEVVRKGHFEALAQARTDTTFLKESVTTLRAGIQELAAVAQKAPASDAKTTLTMAGTRVGLSTVEAGPALRTALGQEYVAGVKGMRDRYRPLVRVNGIDVVMKGTQRGVQITIVGPNGPVQAASQTWGAAKWESSADGRGIGITLCNLINDLPGTRDKLSERLLDAETELAGLVATDVTAAFPRESELEALQVEEQNLRAALGFPDPNEAADDEIEDVEEPERVLADDFPNVMNKDAIIRYSTPPRVGDIIQDPKRSTKQYLVAEIQEGGLYALADPTTGEPERESSIAGIENFRLVARERSALTAAETMLLDMPPTHEIT
ncbi:MAG: DEAD/DEAH box helicase family protein, partial [Galactobacter sp.]